MADLTPPIPAGRQVIQAYGDGGFRIAGTRHEGPVLVFPDRTVAWKVPGVADIDLPSLTPVMDSAPGILLIGGGRMAAHIGNELRTALREAGIVADVMDTGAACRTFNVLLSEDRDVAAALIAV